MIQTNEPSAAKPKRSTSTIDWATLMRRGMGIDVLDCPRCHERMVPIAVITDGEVIERILSHLHLPHGEQLKDGSVVYDVTDELWAEGEFGEEASRGPPCDWDGVDAPAPNEAS